jgi:glucans biosynthesis protein
MRLHLTLGLITALLLFLTFRFTERHHFNFGKVQATAERMSHEPFVPLPNTLPPQLAKLTPQQEQGIFWNDKYRLWKNKGLPFQVDFYPLSKEFPNAIQVNTVDNRGAHELGTSSAFFNYLNLNFNPPLPDDLGYAGFYLRYPINKSDSLDGFFSVQGASYFRVIAKDQVYGLSARALAINSGMDKPEEFPQFKEWWLHQPEPNATSLVVDALLDSPSVTGAYTFKIIPGASTIVEVHASLYFRKSVEWIGLAPFSSMYLYGENASNHFNNFHPEIHDSDGVLLHTGKDDWIWRPLAQATQLQLYRFSDDNPKGFGLLQRDREFSHYQDLDLKYNVRPSAWVTPRGDWGKGAVVLVHRPSNDFNTDNVVLFWHPDQTPKAGDRMELNYNIDFYMNDAQRPPLAFSRETWVINDPPPPAIPIAPIATSTGTATKAAAPAPAPAPPPAHKPGDIIPVMFMVDFVGNGIENIPYNHPPYLQIQLSPPETKLRESSLEKIGYDNSWRATFTIIPFKHNVPTEIHCRLMESDQPGAKPLSEDWTYTWHQ